MMRTVLVIAALLAVTANARPADAQTPSDYDVHAETQDKVSNHVKLIGHVEMAQGDMKVYADEVEWFQDEDRAVASGNVTFTQGNNTISADRAEVNTKTHLGKFYNASGIATIQPQRQRPTPGAIAVPPSTAGQLTDVYFFGDVVEKVAVRRYKITNGGFSTCVQPTPRWDLHADTVELNIDHYTLLKQVIFNVKGVPMLYVPFMLYPTKEDGRATGFLIPTYGSSSIRGQSLHNAFFWAINRSQDATIMHDWYSQSGQAYGGEYRYNRGTGDGTMTAHIVNDRQIGNIPATRSYEIRGNAIEALAPNVRLRGNVNYFSSVTTMQTFNTNLYDASQNSRTIGVNLVGTWRNYFLNGTYNRTEYFNPDSSSVLTGTSPQIVLTKTEREVLRGSQLYFGGTTEFDRIDRRSSSASTVTTAGLTSDTGLSRFDVAPQIRYPFKKWQWFTVNTTFQWRDTFYTRSLDPTQTDPITHQALAINQTLNRDYYTVQAQAIGPVFSRVWDTPNNGYAEKFKHTIEPVFSAARTSDVDNFGRIIQTDGIDQAIGTIRYDYGLNNRFYAKRKVGASRLSQSQEILTVSIAQSYYTNKLATQYDRTYQSTYNNNTPTGQQSNYTPVRLDVRGTPTPTFNTTFHAEFASHNLGLLQTNLSSTYNWSTVLQTTAGWSHAYYVPGYNLPTSVQNSLNGTVNTQTRDVRYGLRYQFNYDVQNSTMIQQQLIAFYHAQCCGISFQYSPRNFGNLYSLGQTRTFFISFSLAGLGDFSPMNGALGGVPR